MLALGLFYKPHRPQGNLFCNTLKLELLSCRWRACYGVKSMSCLLKASRPDLEAINALI